MFTDSGYEDPPIMRGSKQKEGAKFGEIFALDGGEWSASRPGRLYPLERTPVPIVEEAGWAPEARGNILCPRWRSNPGRPISSHSLC
jgi:hypothetical protein